MNNKGYAMSAVVYPLLLVCLIFILSIINNLDNKSNLLEKIKKRSNNTCEYSVGYTWKYDYKGSEQKFDIPCDGIYKIELWGAQGGSITGTAYTYESNVRSDSITYIGGKGAYTSGNIRLLEDNTIYIYVGGTPSQTNISHKSGTTEGGYNGGASLASGQEVLGSPGGGATDIRLVNGEWNNFNSLKSRIMVAAGGGGANFRNYGYGEGNGGEGGTLKGISGYEALTPGSYFRPDFDAGYGIGLGGYQTIGGNEERHLLNGNTMQSSGNIHLGTFGMGANNNQTGGGSGYYAGGSTGHGGAGGGSSFISGYPGCNAISAESTKTNIIHTDQPIHYSGYYFTNSKMIAGNENMPTHNGNSTMIGNTGNGYVVITLISIIK